MIVNKQLERKFYIADPSISYTALTYVYMVPTREEMREVLEYL